MERFKVSKWIPVEKELPKLPLNVDSDEFLIAWTPILKNGGSIPQHFYQIATWDKFNKKWYFSKGAYELYDTKVLAWMDLPPQFREDE